jgi:hypothetical protein
VTWRKATALALLTVLLTGLIASAAGAYEGTSLFDQIAPPPAHGDHGYPLSRYGLDWHISAGLPTTNIPVPVLPDLQVPTGLPDFDGIGPAIMSLFTNAIFTLHCWLAAMTLALFDFAWSFKLIKAALGPVLDSTDRLYGLFGGYPFLIGVVCMVVWMAVRSFRGAIASTAAQLAVAVMCVLACFTLIHQGKRIATEVSSGVDNISLGVLATSFGDGDSDGAKQSVHDGMRAVMIHNFWMIYEFGGWAHCIDKDGKPVNPLTPGCTKVKHDKYGELYLRAGEPNGKGRTLVYNAIKDGKNPTADEMDDADVPSNLFDGVRLSEKDKAGVDMQQQPAAFDRFAAVLIGFLGNVGLDLLIGGLAASVVVAQAVFLLLIALAAVVLVATPIPRFGPDLFREYLEKLVWSATRKVWNAIILALVVVLLDATQKAAGTVGALATTGASCLFAWGLFLMRDDIYDRLQRALSGRAHRQRRVGEIARDVVWTARAARPVADAAVGAYERVRGDERNGGHGGGGGRSPRVTRRQTARRTLATARYNTAVARTATEETAVLTANKVRTWGRKVDDTFHGDVPDVELMSVHMQAAKGLVRKKAAPARANARYARAAASEAAARTAAGKRAKGAARNARYVHATAAEHAAETAEKVREWGARASKLLRNERERGA